MSRRRVSRSNTANQAALMRWTQSTMDAPTRWRAAASRKKRQPRWQSEHELRAAKCRPNAQRAREARRTSRASPELVTCWSLAPGSSPPRAQRKPHRKRLLPHRAFRALEPAADDSRRSFLPRQVLELALVARRPLPSGYPSLCWHSLDLQSFAHRVVLRFVAEV